MVEQPAKMNLQKRQLMNCPEIKAVRGTIVLGQLELVYEGFVAPQLGQGMPDEFSVDCIRGWKMLPTADGESDCEERRAFNAVEAALALVGGTLAELIENNRDKQEVSA